MPTTQTPIAVVTGASSGIGKETALAFARKGYSLVLAARREDKLREVAEQCDRQAGRTPDGQTIVVPTDVTEERQVDALIAAAMDRFGRIDVLVNNAGYGLNARVHETTDDQMRRIFQVNFFGVFYSCKAVAPIMIRQRSGHIFNVSSVAGKRGTPLHGAYSATKFALCGLTDSMRVEMLEHNVHVTSVCPGLTETEFFDKVEGGSRIGQSRFKVVQRRMPASTVARRIARAVGKNVPELVFTASGRAMLALNAVCPRAVDRLMKMYYDDSIQSEKR